MNNTSNELIWLGEEIWIPQKEELLAQLISEASDKNRITPEERSKVDGKYILGIMEGCFFVPNGFSENKRHYSDELWAGAFKSKFVSEKLSSCTFFGTLGHEDKEIDEKDIENGKHSLNTYKLWIDESTGLGMGRSYILNTKAGWNLFTAMKSGSKFKMSSRAKGTFQEGAYKLDESGVKQPVVDPKTFRLLSFDVVFNPGFKQTSAILKENIIVSNRSSEMNVDDLSQSKLLLEKVVVEKAEISAENATLKAELSLKEAKLSALESKQASADKSSSFISNISESVYNIVQNFNKDEWDSLLDNKLKALGESKLISFNKNNYHYDALFLPVELPLVTESKLKSAVNSSNVFESKPVEYAVISKQVNNQFGSNGVVLCWQSGLRPANIFEAMDLFVAKSGLFEVEKPKAKKEDEKEEDKTPSTKDVSFEDKNEGKCGTKAKKEDSEEDEEDKMELKEWRELAEGASVEEFKYVLDENLAIMEQVIEIINTSPYASSVNESVIDKLQNMVSDYEQYTTLGTAQEFSESLNAASMNENGSINEEYITELEHAKKIYSYIEENYGSLEAIDEELDSAKKIYSYIQEQYGSLEAIDEELSNATKIFEYIQEQYGSLEAIDSELNNALKIYSYIEENYGSLEKVNVALATAKNKLAGIKTVSSKSVNESKVENTTSISEAELESKAKEISLKLNGKMSINEVYEVLNDYDGDVNEAHERVFKFVTSGNAAPETNTYVQEHINESIEEMDPIGARVRKSNANANRSLLGGYFDSYEFVKK